MQSLGKDWRSVASRGDVPGYSVFTDAIEKSEQDDRDYRLIQLGNGIQAMLVSDPKADKAAASIDVGVGHLSDPADMPGLAHFCEHLLFMGTEKYPKENEYSEFLAKNGGASNAYTSTMSTNYYFRVGTPALEGALARFAAFFHCPLFTPGCTLRELNAVDSEHKKNHQSDVWRIFQLNKHLSRPGHVWSKFGTGNKESLEKAARDARKKGLLGANGTSGANGNGVSSTNGNVHGNGSTSLSVTPESSRTPSPVPSDGEADGGIVGRETRRRLIEWWTREYCASRMKVCVIGKESLDALSDLVATYFSPIANRGIEPYPMVTESPFGPDEKGTLVSCQTIMDFHIVEMTWPLEWQPPLWEYKPASFVTHFTGHEGPGSLHAYLKGKGWITALSSGPQNLARGFATLKITMHLTREGFKNVRSVMLAAHKYLALLRAAPIEPWVQREISLISRTRFRFKEKRRPDDYAVWVAEHLGWPVPRARVLSAPAIDWEWEGAEGERRVREVLESLRVGEGRAVVMARGGEYAWAKGETSVDAVGTWSKEPVYGTEYKVERFDEAFVREAEAGNDLEQLFLPGRNEFVPTNLDVEKFEVAEPSKRPHLIGETSSSTIWYKKDDQFWSPKAHVMLQISSPAPKASAKASVMTRLYTDLVKDSVNEFAYDAELAGLGYDIGSWNLGISATFYGYNDKLPVLAKHLLERARKVEVKADRLHVFKEQLKRDWKNFFLGQPYHLSDYYCRDMLSDRPWTLMEKLAAIDSVTVEDIQVHMEQLLANTHIQALIVGNMSKEAAISMVDTAERALASAPLPSNVGLEHCLILPESSNHVYRTTVPNPNEPNSSLSYYVHFGATPDAHLRVRAALLAHVLSEPAFNVLRTQEQLGYIVSASQWTLLGDGECGLRVVVQSERSPVYLETRVNAFLRGMERTLAEMPENEFEEHKRGVQRRWREKVKNLKEEAGQFWTQVESGYLDFYRRDHDADLLQNVSKNEILDLFMKRVHPDSKIRAKLSVHVQSQKPRPAKMSEQAIQAFMDALPAAAAVPESWRDDLGLSEGGHGATTDAFTKYWKEHLEQSAAGVQEHLATVAELAKKYPSEEEAGDLEPGVAVIEDLKEFKKGLRVSADAKPLVEWNDLKESGPKL